MPLALTKLQSAVSKVNQANALKAPAALEDSPTIKVCVRVRPFIKEEVEGQRSGGECKLCIDMQTETGLRILNMEGDAEDDARAFEFDRCYWSHSRDHPLFATQETLQKELGETMLEHAMNGFNNCIFAYGQTGSSVEKPLAEAGNPTASWGAKAKSEVSCPGWSKGYLAR
ncbi:unnamed protein product [Effrenium voratum]|nr:unnamed protein product [Effrenium voratum]